MAKRTATLAVEKAKTKEIKSTKESPEYDRKK